MSDITQVIAHFKAKQDGYLEAKNYFEGEVPERFTSERLRRALSNSKLNPVLNFARTPVNAVANRLEITAIAAGDDNAQAFVDRLWDSNDLSIESEDAHLWSLVYGDGYLMVWPSEDGYTINYNTPLTTALFYDIENPRQKRFAAKMWDDNGYTRLNMYYPGVVIKYVTRAEGRVSQVSDLRPYIDEDTDDAGVMESPFDFIPVFHMRTRKPYGQPEHKAAFGAQDLITKNVISQMVANDFHGLPQRYILSETNNDGFDFDDNDKDEPALTAGAGEVWWLENVKAVGQFDAASPADYLEPFREYIRSMATLTDTPLHLFESGFQAPSGESLRVAESPLVKKCRSRASTFGAAWKNLVSALLEHEGLNSDGVNVAWKTIESVSDSEIWDKVRVMTDVGVSLEHALRYGTNLPDDAIEQIITSSTPSVA